MTTLERGNVSGERATPLETPIGIRLARREGPVFARRREPITLGVPLPRGGANDPADFTVWDGAGHQVPCDTRVLDRWSDDSIRWLLVDTQADDQPGGAGPYHLAHRPGRAAAGLQITQDGPRVHVQTGRLTCTIAPGSAFPFADVTADGAPACDPARSRFEALDEAGSPAVVTFDRVVVEDAGALRAVVAVEGSIRPSSGKAPLELLLRLHFHAASPTVRMLVRARNPQKAVHPDGYWDLGAGGSVLLRDFSLHVALPGAAGDLVARCSPEVGAPFERVDGAFTLYQDSSGGENWKSSNHVNRLRKVPNTFRGYRWSVDGVERDGLRATPIVSLQRGSAQLSAAVPHFWQNFPKAIEAADGAVTVRFFPKQYADLHEIQGGEQKTHELFLAFARDTVTDEPLAWCRQRLVPHAPPDWYCASNAIAYLTPAERTVSRPHRELIDAAIDGADTFAHKREVVDEYGWRHFGDIYGDHEGVFHKGPAPLVSHYNNQYDPVGGFGTQFLRSGDVRWWTMMEELAAHVVDIDIYHTVQDKWAYNHGLFWHTYHYGDADTATHRSYPRAGAKVIGGGGPSPDQNYTSGLMLHYFLTGDAASRETVIDSAQYVIDVDDGTKTVFRWLDRGYTGLATASGTYSYHGPGRSPANSINALVDGYRLTGRRRFLDKAELLIVRCAHPEQDIEALNLLDAENKWFYLMFLQSIGKFLDEKAEHGQFDAMYAHARGTLLHYARWMAGHERPFLEQPEKLEFPTETWAAQDIRKSDVFLYAAQHAEGEERALFLERGRFFFRYATDTLAGMPTRTLARPVILLLSNGWLHAWVDEHPEARKPAGLKAQDFPALLPFEPQKTRAMRRAKRLLLTGGSAAAAAAGYIALRSLL